ncbi:DNA recombination protein RmuC [Oceanivirga miroungae]|uniref:DNA recombination protein RmuC n=1 Tax=Oceanivirga miroungae TaxID=1130046 RepID=A0A6I8M8Y3_9FUSO|nr:DNA recombination protein RmuC [Oceanivirga miroungae]VWL84758.1 hypothetical protein OMES3154_00006 [Oceanivirga miroungae]
MNSLVYILLSILIILVLFLIYTVRDLKNNKKDENFKFELNNIVKDENFKTSSSIISELNTFKEGIKGSLNSDIDKLVLKLDEKLIQSNKIYNEGNENLVNFKESITKTANENISNIIKNLDDNFKLNGKNIQEFKDGIKSSINKDVENLVLKVEEKLRESNMLDKKTVETLSEFKENVLNGINKKVLDLSEIVNQRLNDGFEKTERTYKELLNKLVVVDEAQKNIMVLSEKIESFKEIFKDKKARGSFGEMILEQVLNRVYGDSSVYERQYKFGNGKIVDAVVHINDKENILCIDSKFPLENYLKFVEDPNEINRKSFIQDIKKHIDDISNKYIIKGVTLNVALMFIPSESIYMEIYSEFYEDILNYAYDKKVWIVSPKSLMIYITTLNLTTLNYRKNKNSEIILKNLNDFSVEFERFSKRWEKLKTDFKNLEKDFKELDTTSEKITKKFYGIANMIDKEQDDEAK